jgi:hypothetical protein
MDGHVAACTGLVTRRVEPRESALMRPAQGATERIADLRVRAKNEAARLGSASKRLRSTKTARPQRGRFSIIMFSSSVSSLPISCLFCLLRELRLGFFLRNVQRSLSLFQRSLEWRRYPRASDEDRCRRSVSSKMGGPPRLRVFRIPGRAGAPFRFRQCVC